MNITYIYIYCKIYCTFASYNKRFHPFRLFSSVTTVIIPTLLHFQQSSECKRDGFLFNVSHRVVIYDAARNKKRSPAVKKKRLK